MVDASHALGQADTRRDPGQGNGRIARCEPEDAIYRRLLHRHLPGRPGGRVADSQGDRQPPDGHQHRRRGLRHRGDRRNGFHHGRIPGRDPGRICQCLRNPFLPAGRIGPDFPGDGAHPDLPPQRPAGQPPHRPAARRLVHRSAVPPSRQGDAVRHAGHRDRLRAVAAVRAAIHGGRDDGSLHPGDFCGQPAFPAVGGGGSYRSAMPPTLGWGHMRRRW